MNKTEPEKNRREDDGKFATNLALRTVQIATIAASGRSTRELRRGMNEPAKCLSSAAASTSN